MAYSGSEVATAVRLKLGEALAALQSSPDVPEEVMEVAQNIAQAVGALFEAAQAEAERQGKKLVQRALGSLSQTLALLQETPKAHPAIETTTQTIAEAMTTLFRLSSTPSEPAAAHPSEANAFSAPSSTAARRSAVSAPVSQAPESRPVQNQPPIGQPNQISPSYSAPLESASKAPVAQQESPVVEGASEYVEVNVGASTDSNFYVGFSGEVSEGGIFVSTYQLLRKSTPVDVLITFPGGFEIRAHAHVAFVRDSQGASDEEAPPGMGLAFESLNQEQRELILRFIRKRPPMFYDV